MPRKSILGAAGVPTSDPNTLLLVHSDTSDGSTTFVDSSSYGRTATVGGGCQHDTAQKKFGASSILMDGSGDYLTFPDSSDWNWTAFTVECWIRWNSTSGNQGVLGHHTANAYSGINWAMQFKGNTRKIEGNISNNGSTGAGFVSSTAFSAGTWYHLALVATSSRILFFINGTAEDDVSATLASNDVSAPFRIGQHVAGNFAQHNGWMDEIRYSDIARWDAIFTPPTAAYS